jgi:hypothetical protein
MKKELIIWGAVAAAVAALSTILPWVSAMGTSVSLVNGDGPDGLILLGAASLFAVSVFVWPASIGTRVFAVINGGLGIYESLHIHYAIQDAKAEAGGFGALVSVGFGAYLCLLASVALVAWAGFLTYQDVKARQQHRSQLVNGTWVREGESS